MGEQITEYAEEKRVRLAFKATFLELYRFRRSIINLYRIAREEKKRLRKLEKIVSSFVKPN